MDPNHRNAQPLGAGISQVFPVAQGTGYELQYGQVQGFQQAQNKPFNLPGMMGNNTFIPNYPMMHQGQGSVIANVQGGIPSAGPGGSGALPSMGTFVGNFNQANITMGRCVLPSTGYKDGLDSWHSPTQQSGSVNALPSFGHFLMQQPYQQPSPQQQHQQQLQQQQLQQQIFQTNQNQSRFPSALLQHGNIGHFVPNSSGVSGMIANLGNQPQNFSSVNMNINMNANLVGNFGQFSNANIMGCQNLSGPANPCGATVLTSSGQIPHPSSIPISSINPQQQMTLPVMSPQVAASCNQVTNTTSSVITTTSATCTTPVMAHMHSMSVTSTHVTMATSQSSMDVTVDRKPTGMMSTKQDPYLVGCEKIQSKTEFLGHGGEEDSKTSLQCSSKGQSDTPQLTSTPSANHVIVPAGWRRVVEEGAIVYYSPSNTKLSSTQEIGRYLSQEGTCKCGLECPVLVDQVFSFDITVQSRQWTLDVHCAEDLTKLCNHKRKVLAMATFQNSRSLQSSLSVTSPVLSSSSVSSGAASTTTSTSSITSPATSNTKKESKGKKKKSRSSSQNPYDRLLVSELLAQREKQKMSALQAVGKEKVSSPDSVVSTARGMGGTGTAPGDPFTEQSPIRRQDSKSPGARSDRSQVKSGSVSSDPSDDLGPISSSKVVKLDFSHGRGTQEDASFHHGSNMPGDTSVAQNAQFLQHQNQLTVQTVFSQEHMKEVFIQQSPTNHLRTSPGYGFIPPNHALSCGNFGSSMPCGSSPVNVPQNMGVVVQGVHQGNFPVYQLQNTPGRFMNPQLDQNHLLTGTSPYHMNAMHNMGFGARCPFDVGPQQSMYHPPNPVFQSADPLWTEKKKAKPKKSKVKKEKQKVNSVFESDTPPPNVDVSQLHDQGRGPIPKVKSSSSFLDNPSAFLAEQTALISNSMTSTLSSPTCSTGTSESSTTSTMNKDGKNDTVDGDIVIKTKLTSQTSGSSMVNTATISFPKPTFTSTQALAPVCGGTVVMSKESSSFIKPNQHSLESAGIFLKLPNTGSESHLQLPDANQDMFTEDRCESLSPDSGSESLVFTETITPSSVVHHTPATTEDDGGSKNDSQTQSKDKNFNVDKSVVPKVTNHTGSAVSKSVTDEQAREKSSPLDSTLANGPRFARNVGGTNLIQQMLGHHSSTEFPASSLLSAAARAQMVQQQQSQMNILINQQQPVPNIQISQSFPITMNPGSTTLPVGVDGKSTQTSSAVGTGSDIGSMTVNQSLPGGLGVVSNPSHTSSILSAVQCPSSTVGSTNKVHSPASVGKTFTGDNDSETSGPGTETISKILAQPVNGINTTELLKQGHFDGNLMKHLSNLSGHSVIGPAGINAVGPIQTNSVNAPMPPISLPLVTAVTNSLTQVIPAVGTNGSQNILSQQAMMNLFNNLGLNTMQNAPSATGQGAQMLVTGQVLPSDMSCLSLVNNAVGPNAYLNGINQSNFPRFIGCNNLTQNIDMGNMVSTPRNMMDPNILNKSNGAVAQMVSMEHQGGGMQMKSAAEPDDIANQVNKMQLPCEQIMPSVTTSSGQVVLLPNIQMPLLQVLGANQVSAANPAMLDKAANCSLQPQQYPVQSQADIQALIGQLQAGLTQVGTPLNMMNVQQVWNNLTTGNNLTAMQLQTLQLQQQLLQQIQQLQGMQTLISQFNMQSHPGNPLTSVANKNVTTTVSNGLATVAMATDNSAETCLTMDGKTFLAPHSVTGESMIMPLNTAVDLSNPELKIHIPTSTVTFSNMDDGSDHLDSTFIANDRKNGSDHGCRTNVSSSVFEGCSLASSDSFLCRSSQPLSVICGAVTSCGNAIDTSYSTVQTYSSDSSSGIEDGINSTQCSLVTTSCITEQDQSPASTDISSNRPEEIAVGSGQLGTNVTEGTESNQKDGSVSEDQTCSNQDCDRATASPNSCSVVSGSGYSHTKETCSNPKSSYATSVHMDMGNSGSSTEHGNEEKTTATMRRVSDNVAISISRSQIESSNFQNIDAKQRIQSRPQLAVSTVSSTVGGVDKDDKLRQKSSPEHDPSIAEKPKEANLPSDVATATKANLSHRVGVNFFHANHLLNTVELSSERAQKAADALTRVSRVVKRPREIDSDSFDDDESSSDEMSLSSYPHNFLVGDLVWGQIRGFPSWPGKVVDEADVKEAHTPNAGKCWVQWFGDHTFTEVEPDKLKSLSEGLEAHHRARKKYRKGRKMNSNLEAAIHEAMTELDRQAQETECKAKAVCMRGKANKKRKTR